MTLGSPNRRILAAALAAYFAACSNNAPSQNEQPVGMNDGGGPNVPAPDETQEGEEGQGPSDSGAPMDGGTTSDGGAVQDSATTLSAAEVALLVFTREEEKLARDVYLTLDAMSPIFDNIAESEQTHMDAVLTLLERYGIPDPVGSNPVGVFTDPTLQALYNDLVARGSVSTLAALSVGLEIEELDIRDLTAALDVTDRVDIELVLQNLLRGSRNHLRAFYDRLTALGGTYTPKYIDEATFLAIATSPLETGGPPGY